MQRLPSDLIDEAEKYWINYFRDSGCPLVNSTEGGVGVYHPTEEVKKKMSVCKKGKLLSPTHRQALSKASKGKNKSATHVENIKKSQIKRRLDELVKSFTLEQQIQIKLMYESGYTLSSIAFVFKSSRRGITRLLRYLNVIIKKRGFGGNCRCF
jgi:hypothetical protein